MAYMDKGNISGINNKLTYFLKIEIKRVIFASNKSGYIVPCSITTKLIASLNHGLE